MTLLSAEWHARFFLLTFADRKCSLSQSRNFYVLPHKGCGGGDFFCYFILKLHEIKFDQCDCEEVSNVSKRIIKQQFLDPSWLNWVQYNCQNRVDTAMHDEHERDIIQCGFQPWTPRRVAQSKFLQLKSYSIDTGFYMHLQLQSTFHIPQSNCAKI